MHDAHYRALEELKDSPEDSLGYSHVPWPPKHNLMLITAADTPADKSRKAGWVVVVYSPSTWLSRRIKQTLPQASHHPCLNRVDKSCVPQSLAPFIRVITRHTVSSLSPPTCLARI